MSTILPALPSYCEGIQGRHNPCPQNLTNLFSCTSWMFSMPMALLRREPNGPDFFLVGLFPGTISDCRERPQLSIHLPRGPGAHSSPQPWGPLP